VLVVVYLISPPVVSYTVWRSGLVQHNWIVVPTVIALWPAYRLADDCSAVDSLYNAEFELLTDLFGNPYPWNRAN